MRTLTGLKKKDNKTLGIQSHNCLLTVLEDTYTCRSAVQEIIIRKLFLPFVE